MEQPVGSSAVGECSSCRKRYRVPNAQGTYACKQCGSPLAIVEPQRKLEIDALTCGACQALNPLGSRFCGECGAALAPESTASDRKQALRDVSRAIRALRNNRILYGALAALYLGLAGLFALALGASAAGNELVKTWGSPWLAVALIGSIGAVFAAGAIFIVRQPFFWSVLIAALCTVSAFLSVIAGSPSILGICFSVATWWRVFETAKARRVLLEHPDLNAARWYRRETGKYSGPESARLTERRAAERARRKQRLVFAGAALAVIVVVTAVVAVAYRFLSAPPSFERRAESFASSWNEHGLVGIAPLFAADQSTERASEVSAAAKLHGWVDGFPPIQAAGRVEDCGTDCKRVVFASRDGEIVTQWRVLNGDWALTEVRTPTAAIARSFQDAWNRSDAAAISAFFRTPERFEPELRKLVERLGWSAALPQVGKPFVEDYGDVFRATFDTSQGSLVVDWRFEGGRWKALTLTPPKKR